MISASLRHFFTPLHATHDSSFALHERVIYENHEQSERLSRSPPAQLSIYVAIYCGIYKTLLDLLSGKSPGAFWFSKVSLGHRLGLRFNVLTLSCFSCNHIKWENKRPPWFWLHAYFCIKIPGIEAGLFTLPITTQVSGHCIWRDLSDTGSSLRIVMFVDAQTDQHNPTSRSRSRWTHY